MVAGGPARSFTLATMWEKTAIHQENKAKWDVTWIDNRVISQDGLENGFDAWDHFFKAPTTVWFGVFFSHMIKSARVFRVSCLEVPEMRWTKRSIDPKFASQLSRAFLRFCSSIDCLGLVILAAPWFLFNPTIPHLYRFHMLPWMRHAFNTPSMFETPSRKNMAETCWKTLAACFMLALLAKVQKAFIFGRLLQARVDNHSRNLGKMTTRRFFKTRGSLQTGPRYPPIIPGSKRPSSWSRCQPPKWPCKKSNSSSKLANVFVSSRLTWTTVFLIQIHPVQVQWNKIIDHWGEFPSSTTLDRGSGDVCCNIPTQCFFFKLVKPSEGWNGHQVI